MTEPQTPPSAQENIDRDDQVIRYRRRLEEVADLVARIRHEINNPLTGVLGQAQLLLREDLSDRARKRAVTIEELAIRIRDIVAQLREVQRPTTDGEDNETANTAGPGL
jgi:signal transduction histidine kinase